MDEVHFSGGGGTNLQPVFDHFAGKNPDHPEAGPPTVLIVFSDFYCGKIKEDPGYPVIWISVDNPNAEVNFGTLINYELKYARDED
jgi:predicted metal-dependent peptidase